MPFKFIGPTQNCRKNCARCRNDSRAPQVWIARNANTSAILLSIPSLRYVFHSKPLSSSACHDWLNQNHLSQLLADGKPRIADLTNEIVPAGNQFHDLIFTQSDFAQAVLDFGRGTQLLDSHSDSGLNPIQRAHLATRPLPGLQLCLCLIHIHPGRIAPINRLD
jgi:hypothetical protein